MSTPRLDALLAGFPPELHNALTRNLAEQALTISEQLAAQEADAHSKALIQALRHPKGKGRGRPGTHVRDALQAHHDMVIAETSGLSLTDAVRLLVAYDHLVSKNHNPPAAHIVESMLKALQRTGGGTVEIRKLQAEVKRRCERVARERKKSLQIIG